jgi:hypothetical protein
MSAESERVAQLVQRKAHTNEAEQTDAAAGSAGVASPAPAAASSGGGPNKKVLLGGAILLLLNFIFNELLSDSVRRAMIRPRPHRHLTRRARA